MGTSVSENVDSSFFAVVGSFLCWFNLYGILCIIFPQFSLEWQCRVVTVVHAVISTLLSGISGFILGPWPFNYVGQQSTEFHTLIIIISLGYFVFDFLWCVYMRTEGPVMLAHHSLSIFGLCYVTYYKRHGCEIMALLGGSEFTNPLLQLRWFWKETGKYHGTKAVVLDWMFVVSFLIARLGVGTAFLIVFLTSPYVTNWIPRVGGTGFYLISFVFGIQLIQFLRKKYFHSAPKN